MFGHFSRKRKFSILKTTTHKPTDRPSFWEGQELHAWWWRKFSSLAEIHKRHTERKSTFLWALNSLLIVRVAQHHLQFLYIYSERKESTIYFSFSLVLKIGKENYFFFVSPSPKGKAENLDFMLCVLLGRSATRETKSICPRVKAEKTLCIWLWAGRVAPFWGCGEEISSIPILDITKIKFDVKTLLKCLLIQIVQMNQIFIR